MFNVCALCLSSGICAVFLYSVRVTELACSGMRYVKLCDQHGPFAINMTLSEKMLSDHSAQMPEPPTHGLPSDKPAVMAISHRFQLSLVVYVSMQQLI